MTKYLRATATYQDRHARNQSAFSDASAQVTAHVQSVAPEITSAATFTVDEGTTAVETLTAEDQDSAAADLEWSKAGGADASEFTLSTAGDLAFAAAPDYENPGDADGTGPMKSPCRSATATHGHGGYPRDIAKCP